MPEETPSELEQLKKERDEYLNGWKRAKADLINYQKEEARRLEDVIRYSNAGLIKELITVLDSFGLALSVMEKAGKSEKGITMIKSQLEEAMRKAGVEKVTVTVGGPFDANFHEAVAEAESDKPAGSIMEVVEQGYSLQGRVIRPARVVLSKGASSSSS
jgi:molecular chaperone GrpE